MSSPPRQDGKKRVEELRCIDCGGHIGTIEIDASGMHGDPVYRDDDDSFAWAGYDMSGRIYPRCNDCTKTNQ